MGEYAIASIKPGVEMDFKVYEKEDLKNFSMRPMIIKIEDKDGNEIKW